MTLEDYERMFDAQGGVCAICGKPRPEERTLHVDHDHETGEIRGLLCFSCNNALGRLPRSSTRCSGARLTTSIGTTSSRRLPALG